ncbi:MAG TPA: LacI family DNA-binding transcriptional regulator [Candidatus Alectryocaccobium stercorigallinarum]|nr:LacI family DNA-binding transcriptional regulator [Candidatus Alectryocaccobium stercorigallinarum]
MRARKRKIIIYEAEEYVMVTLQQIADKAGVSRGTVDRALNNRGRINPEVKARIEQIAEELGYQPNRAGKALAMARRSVKIGVIITSTDTPFMQTVLQGIEEAKREVESLGAEVIVKKIKGAKAEDIMKAMEELRSEDVKGLALTSAEGDDAVLSTMINTYVEEYGIPVVTFNRDIKGTKRMCYVGQDALKGGKTAAGLMAEIVPENGKVLIISGYPSNKTSKNRDSGFMQEIKHVRPDIEILDVRYAYDNGDWAAEIARDALNEHKDLSGIYVSYAGVGAVCRKIEEMGLEKKLKIISNDIIPVNCKYLKKGEINFLIGQDAYTQGHDPIMILFDYLFDGTMPEDEYVYTEIVIKTKYNL